MKSKKRKISITNKVLICFAIIITCLSIYFAYCTMNDINIPVLDYMMGNKNVKNAKTSDLTGTWKSNEKETYQEATITKDEIVIYWVSTDSKSLYWQGTYTPPKNNTNDYLWESKADHKVTDKALLASQDDKKKFAYKDGIISYEATAMGVTKTVKLEKVK